MKEIYERISKAVKDIIPEATEGLAKCISFPSVSDTEGEGQVQSWIAEEVEKAGLELDVWCTDIEEIKDHPSYTNFSGADCEGCPNVVGVWKGSGGGKSILFNGHCDVVAPGELDRWDYSPWDPVVIDGKMHGRGAMDMKGGLMMQFYAIKALKNAGIKLKGDVIFESVPREETGGMCTLDTVLRGYKADLAIVTEATGIAVAPYSSGISYFTIYIDGRAAHPAVRNTGVSAFDKFLPIYQAIRKLEDDINAQINLPCGNKYNMGSINVNWVDAGGPLNAVPEKLMAKGRYGFYGFSLAEAQKKLEQYVAEVAEQDEWLREHPPRIEWNSGDWEPGTAPIELAQELAKSFKTATGEEAAIEAMPYGSDLRILIKVGEMPTMLFGPGDIGKAHFPNEFVPLDEYEKGIAVLATFIADWCGVEE